MSVTIKSWFAVHDGKTKFYQVFAISSSESAKAYIVTHWGPYSSASTPSPKFDGQCKAVEVKRAEVDWEADRVMSGKKKRGYAFCPNINRELHDPEATSRFLYEHLKTSHASEIYTGLTGDGSYTNPAVGEMDLEHLFRPSSKEADETEASDEPKHEEWGTW